MFIKLMYPGEGMQPTLLYPSPQSLWKHPVFAGLTQVWRQFM